MIPAFKISHIAVCHLSNTYVIPSLNCLSFQAKFEGPKRNYLANGPILEVH